MLIKNIIIYHLTPIRIATTNKNKTQKTTSIVEEVEKIAHY